MQFGNLQVGVPMTDEQAKNEIQMFLGAFPANLLREALKGFSLSNREQRLTGGWTIWTEDADPPKSLEWKKIGTLVYVRQPPPPDERTTVKASKANRTSAPSAKVKICPHCGSDAFAQAVCPKCAKGKAGIRQMWICDDNNDHVFYTE
jgi:hypothetical protein